MMIKLVVVFIISCEWVVGAWEYIGLKMGKKTQYTEQFVEIKSFKEDGTYISFTLWDTVYGKWYMNSACDSIGVYTNKINPNHIKMLTRILYSNDTIILQNETDEAVANSFYKKK